MSTGSATTTAEVDPTLKKAITLLHSPDPQSATELRVMLDEIIKQRYGPTKMLCNVLSKKQLEWEKQFPGIETAQEVPAADEVINLTNSPVKTLSDSPDTIPDSDDGAVLTMATSEEVENLKEFGDLNCCVCGEMMFTATNRLIECSQCGSLYHQECHKPAITNEEASEDQEHNWQCNNCNDKPSTSRAAAAAVAATATSSSAAAVTVIPDDAVPSTSKTKSSASSSRSSSSSNSSSPFYKQEHPSSSSSKHHKSSSSSSKSNKEERTSSGSGASKVAALVTPAINVISAPDKSSNTSSKKSSSSHSSSSKSSSKSSSSKHHESGSSNKRKLSK